MAARPADRRRPPGGGPHPLLVVYRLLLTLLSPLVLGLLLWRASRGKEDWRRLPERLGWASRPRPAGPLLWLHAASVGELASLRPLLEALAAQAAQRGRPLPAVLVTSVTRTAAALAPQLLPAGVIHQLAPVDHWLALALFRRHWRPSLGLLAEAELWPELLQAMPGRLLINARISARSWRRHRRLPWLARWLYGGASACFAQSAADAERLQSLGAPPARALGSTKWDSPALAVDHGWVARLRALWPTRRVLLLASSHAGEDELLLAAWPELRRRLAPLVPALLLAPRHPERAERVRQLVRAAGVPCVLTSELPPASPPGSAGPHEPAVGAPEVVVVDRLGLMGSWIAAAHLVLIGGSLRPGGRSIGGHNPLEPVRGGKPVLCGPDMANFDDLCGQLQRAGWLWQAPEAAALWPEAARLLSRPPALPALPPITGPSAAIAALVLERLD